jgi:hypothetical protein
MKIKEAHQAGAQAFAAGKMRAPALNQAFIVAACNSPTNTVKLLKAYNDGWTLAMLAEPLPTRETEQVAQ